MSKPKEPPVQAAGDGQPGRDWSIPAHGFERFEEAAVHLRRPFTPEAIRFKVQSVFHKDQAKQEPKGCMVVGYIDARLVIERLNFVVPAGWTANYRPADRLLWCDLTVCGIVRSDVGESGKQGFSKDHVSDALKRAAVHFGVGVSIYTVPQIFLWAEHIGNGNLEKRRGPKDKQGKPTVTLGLTEKGDAKVRDGYRGWLEEHGVRKFGPTLDHGDREGQLHVPDDEPEPEPADDETEALRNEARAAYEALGREKATGVELFPAEFQRLLAGSPDELRALIARVKEAMA